jgi:uncharacterized membrane protein YdjX (TVP38/TMEM64 family)
LPQSDRQPTCGQPVGVPIELILQQPVLSRLLKQMKKEQQEMSEPISIETPAQTAKPASPLRRWMPLAALATAVVAAWSTGLHEYMSLNAIAENRDALMAFVSGNLVLAGIGFMTVYMVAVALSLPGASLLTILGGFLFGWMVGGTLTVLGATAGAVIIFMVARTSLGETLASRAGPWMNRLSQGFRDDAFNYLLFLRLVPVFPFWLVNIAPALAGVSLGTYALTTLIGIIPGTFAFSVLGSGLDSIIEAQKATFDACVAEKGASNCTFSLDVGALVTPELLAAFAALGFVALIPVIFKKLKARK